MRWRMIEASMTDVRSGCRLKETMVNWMNEGRCYNYLGLPSKIITIGNDL